MFERVYEFALGSWTLREHQPSSPDSQAQNNCDCPREVRAACKAWPEVGMLSNFSFGFLFIFRP